MKKLIAILLSTVAATLLLCVTACNPKHSSMDESNEIGDQREEKFGSIRFYDRAVDWVTKDFIENNKTYYGGYKNGRFGKNNPKTITHIISSQNEFDGIFTYYPC